MPTISADTADKHLCPYNSFAPCVGPRCMAWAWVGRSHDRCETDNLVETDEGQRPLGVPKAPDGEGWEADGAPFPKSYHQSKKLGLPPATAQRWSRELPRSEGQCSRHPGDHGCYPW